MPALAGDRHNPPEGLPGAWVQLGPRGPGAHTWTAPQQAPCPHPALQALLGVLPAPSWGFCQAGRSFAQFSPAFPIWHRGGRELSQGAAPPEECEPGPEQVQTSPCDCRMAAVPESPVELRIITAQDGPSCTVILTVRTGERLQGRPGCVWSSVDHAVPRPGAVRGQPRTPCISDFARTFYDLPVTL